MVDLGIRDASMGSILVYKLVYRYLGILDCFGIRLLVDNSDDICTAKQSSYQNIYDHIYSHYFNRYFAKFISG